MFNSTRRGTLKGLPFFGASVTLPANVMASQDRDLDAQIKHHVEILKVLMMKRHPTITRVKMYGNHKEGVIALVTDPLLPMSEGNAGKS